ncbi:MAG: ABC transporter ATP-binding protein [Terracidiphilus sp.]
MTSETLLHVRLDAEYAGKSALRDIRFEIGRGEVLGLVGPSGAGKSTLVHSLLGLLAWRGGRATGEVLLNGENLLTMSDRQMRDLRGRSVVLVPQSPISALNPAISLERHFREVWRAHEKNGRAAFISRVRDLLAEVQLPSDTAFLARRPSQISVGQAQRILIAMALLHEPSLSIADEPTSALDPVTQAQILALLRRLNRERGVTFLYVSHDLVSVLQLSHRIAVLHAGTVVETLPVEELDRARHPTTISLLSTLPAPPEVLLKYQQNSEFETSEFVQKRELLR